MIESLEKNSGVDDRQRIPTIIPASFVISDFGIPNTHGQVSRRKADLGKEEAIARGMDANS